MQLEFCFDGSVEFLFTLVKVVNQKIFWGTQLKTIMGRVSQDQTINHKSSCKFFLHQEFLMNHILIVSENKR